jgi:predicted transcriptional regulator
MPKIAENTIKFTISLAPHIKEALEKLAKEKGLSRSSMVAVAIDKILREEGKS